MTHTFSPLAECLNMQLTPNQRIMIIVLMAVQFVNITDFMIVLPLSADFVRSLGIASADMGLVSGVYKGAAAISALGSAFFLDRLNRQRALLLSLFGLLIGSFFTGLATDLPSLLAARLVAGLCTGPVTSLALSLVIEQLPVTRRGYAMSRIMSAFPLATVLSVPLALELSLWSEWRLAFSILSVLGMVTLVAVALYIPKHRPPVRDLPTRPASDCVLQPSILVPVYIMTALAMITGFLLIPNLAIYLQHNLHYPREYLSLLYFVGGLSSFLALQLGGQLIDRWGSLVFAWLGTGLLVLVLVVGFIMSPPLALVMPIFCSLMMAISIRTLAVTTFISSLPAPDRCAGFLSLNAAIQHLASAVGSVLATRLLTTDADGSLQGMHQVGLLAVVCAISLPLLLGWLMLYRRRASQHAALNLPSYPTAVLISQEKTCP